MSLGAEFIYSIDSCPHLLQELKDSALEKQVFSKIKMIEDDFLTFQKHLDGTLVDLIVCMGDSPSHLASLHEINILFQSVFDSLLPDGGIFLLQFRDLTKELYEGDRFIPIKSDERTVFTCFLEWLPLGGGGDIDDGHQMITSDGSGRTVKVFDLVHVKKGIGAWELCTSWYKKLALSLAFCHEKLKDIGFRKVESQLGQDGMVFIKALK